LSAIVKILWAEPEKAIDLDRTVALTVALIGDVEICSVELPAIAPV
jgi:hypothetical protein